MKVARAVLFWGACIPLRLYLARQGNNVYLRAGAGVVAYRWLSGLEASRVGVFGGPAWWAGERPLHGLLWGAYAVLGSDTFLYTDVALGALNWVSNIHRQL